MNQVIPMKKAPSTKDAVFEWFRKLDMEYGPEAPGKLRNRHVLMTDGIMTLALNFPTRQIIAIKPEKGIYTACEMLAVENFVPFAMNKDNPGFSLLIGHQEGKNVLHGYNIPESDYREIMRDEGPVYSISGKNRPDDVSMIGVITAEEGFVIVDLRYNLITLSDWQKCGWGVMAPERTRYLPDTGEGEGILFDTQTCSPDFNDIPLPGFLPEFIRDVQKNWEKSTHG